MAAVGFIYAGAFAIHWQLLIVVSFLVSGTLAFFVVLFDENSVQLGETSSKLETPLEVEHEPEEDFGYQSSVNVKT